MYEIITPNSLGDIDGKIWFNGHKVEWRQARVHFLSHSLHYASAVFDGIRVYDGYIFELRKHLVRLLAGARNLNMRVAFSIDVLAQAALDLVKEHKIINGYIRPLVWRGPGPMDFNPKPNPPNIALAAWPLESFLRENARLILSDYQRPHPNAGPWKTKATGLYLAATLAKAKAISQGYDDALMLSWKNCIADTTGTNIFLVINDVLYTPKPDGFFSGLTMKSILQIAESLTIKSCVEDIPLSSLAKAQEVFLVGTAAGVVSVGEINVGHSEIKYYRPTMTQLLRSKYMDLYKNSHRKSMWTPSVTQRVRGNASATERVTG